MEKIKKICDSLLSYLIGAIIVTMVLLVLWQVFARYVLAEPSTISEEAVRILLIWLAICGGGYAFGSKSHLALDLLTNNLSHPSKLYFMIFLHIITLLLTSGVLVIGGIQMVLLTSKQLTAALQIPVSFLYLSMPIGGVIIIFYEIYHITINYTKIKNS